MNLKKYCRDFPKIIVRVTLEMAARECFKITSEECYHHHHKEKISTKPDIFLQFISVI